MDIYQSLYRRAERELRANDMRFSIREDAYLSIHGKDPFQVHASEAEGLDSEALTEFLYYRLFNRTAEDGVYERLRTSAKALGMDSEKKFRFYLWNHLSHQAEAKRKGKKISGIRERRGQLRQEGTLSFRDGLILSFAGQSILFISTVPQRVLHPFWMMLPEDRRQKIKRKLKRTSL